MRLFGSVDKEPPAPLSNTEQLPLELYETIIEFIPLRGSLLSTLCLVSKNWYILAASDKHWQPILNQCYPDAIISKNFRHACIQISQHLSTLRTQYEPPEKEYAEWRVLLLGFNQVGKSAFLIQYMQEIYVPDYEPMISEDPRKIINVDELICALTITEFSTCLYSEYPKLSADMHKRANGALLMFSIADRNTFEYVETLYQNVCEYRNQTYNFGMVLVGTKSDVEEKREVTRQEAEEYAKKRRMKYIETSSKIRTNINEPIQDLVRRIRQKNGFVDWDKLSSTIEKTKDKKCIMS
jgi:GTPase SAR1 family protein